VMLRHYKNCFTNEFEPAVFERKKRNVEIRQKTVFSAIRYLLTGLIEMRSQWLVALINFQIVLEDGRPANLRKSEGEVK
jgi:hypothetical protein